MIDLPHIQELIQPNESKIVFLVVDGLGGLPSTTTGLSELESANIPNLDNLAKISATGLTTPVSPWVTPGSGPGHLALFGYNPLKYTIGRGILEALGIGIEIGDRQVAIRGNLCTVDPNGIVTDRRAARIPSKQSGPLIKLLDKIDVPNITTSVLPVRDHRFVLLLQGDHLGENVTSNDPESEGLALVKSIALDMDSEKTAVAANIFIEQAGRVLSNSQSANMVLLRGFSKLPTLPSMSNVFKLNAAAIAAYPMYRGIAKLAGMKVLPTGESFSHEVDTLESHFDNHDFFFIHYKPADAAGEDGDFEEKIKALEDLDKLIPRIMDLNADVLVVAGDHSTPSIMGSHSWHSVPLTIHSKLTIGDGVPSFSEKSLSQGSIGRIDATDVMGLSLANAGKLRKFGP
tara:strand:+ start:2912 stop:4117 length:1206 start_codon:yes stop_codon:yes gene_type:complete